MYIFVPKSERIRSDWIRIGFAHLYHIYVRQELSLYTGLAGNDHRSALFALKTNLFIEKYMQYISGVSFFRLHLKSFKPLYAPKEILILHLEF
jgi:hypothetical protein